jgi:hypothetical protein
MRKEIGNKQLEEIKKCHKSPAYFINTYIKIQHPTKGRLDFKTFPFQDDCLNDFEKHRFNIVVKSRQLGLSTLTAAYCLWLSLFHKDKNILVIATKLETAKNFIKKIKFSLDSLPPFLMITEMNVKSVKKIGFANGSSVTAIPTSEDAGRSEALSLLVVDEAAHIANFDELWAGLFPTISTGGKVILISSPNGAGGKYYQLYVDAESGKNDFNPIRLPWNVHPERDQAWFDKDSRQFSGDIRRINQEYLCDFTASGETFLSVNEIEWLQKCIKEPIMKDGDGRKIWIWEEPKLGEEYVISADISRGDSEDCSTFHVISGKTGNIVCEYKGKIKPDHFGELLFQIGMKYNKAVVCPEINSFGYMTIKKMLDMKYPRMFYFSNRFNLHSYLPKDNELPGFSTQKTSRIQALTKLEQYIRAKKITSYSQRFYEEMKTFVWNNNKPIALPGYHDDLVLSLAIGIYVYDILFGGGHIDGFSDELPPPIQIERRGMEDTVFAELMPLGVYTTSMIDKRKAQMQHKVMNDFYFVPPSQKFFRK